MGTWVYWHYAVLGAVVETPGDTRGGECHRCGQSVWLSPEQAATIEEEKEASPVLWCRNCANAPGEWPELLPAAKSIPLGKYAVVSFTVDQDKLKVLGPFDSEAKARSRADKPKRNKAVRWVVYRSANGRLYLPGQVCCPSGMERDGKIPGDSVYGEEVSS
jgi:hypothetical protein